MAEALSVCDEVPAQDFTFVAEALAAHAIGSSDATAQELLRALGMEDKSVLQFITLLDI